MMARLTAASTYYRAPTKETLIVNIGCMYLNLNGSFFVAIRFLQPPLTVEECRGLIKTDLTTVIPDPAQCQAECDWFLAHVTGENKSQWLAYPYKLVSEQAIEGLNDLLYRRIHDRCPIQYLLREAMFYGLRFQVSPAVLIPRPETELLVEAAVNEALRRLQHTEGEVRLVDVGTGTGCIPIAIGHALRSQLSDKDFQRVRLFAIDYSTEALEIAQQNATQHTVAITFYHGSWLQPVLDQHLTVDMIVSNPPYIPSQVCEKLDPEVIGHEPRLALDGGPDGLQPYRELLAQAQQCLTPTGWVGLELGENQAMPLSALTLSSGFQAHVLQDMTRKDRILTGVLLGDVYESHL